MTLWAKRSDSDPQMIEVRGTAGSIALTVTEHQDHVKHFVTQLTALLEPVPANPEA